MAIHLLTARQVQAASNGDHRDGGGLVLKVHNGRARWLFRFTNPAGHRRAMGLGVAHRDSLAAAGRSLVEAREGADKARKQLQAGTDPIEAKAADREKARSADEMKKSAAKHERAILARVARGYHERVIEGSRSRKHAAQWIASLEANVPAELWHKPIADVTAPELLGVLMALQARIPETASRVRQRLDAVFEDAIFHGLASANPAATIRRKLREAKGRRVRGQFRALAYAEAPAVVARAFYDEWARLTGGSPVIPQRIYDRHCACLDRNPCLPKAKFPRPKIEENAAPLERPTPPGVSTRSIEYPFVLADDRVGYFKLPTDLKTAEVKRINVYLSTLAVDAATS